MPNITTCSKCNKLYEAGSEEKANQKDRLCFNCNEINTQEGRTKTVLNLIGDTINTLSYKFKDKEIMDAFCIHLSVYAINNEMEETKLLDLVKFYYNEAKNKAVLNVFKDLKEMIKLQKCCSKNIEKDNYALSGFRKTGDEWECPECKKIYIHICDEAEGCSWELK